MENSELMKRLQKNTGLTMIGALVTFGTLGVIAALVGRGIDMMLGTTPIFSLVILGISYVIGWVAILQLRRQILDNIKSEKEN
jgi:hypothetical protein